MTEHIHEKAAYRVEGRGYYCLIIARGHAEAEHIAADECSFDDIEAVRGPYPINHKRPHLYANGTVYA